MNVPVYLSLLGGYLDLEFKAFFEASIPLLVSFWSDMSWLNMEPEKQ